MTDTEQHRQHRSEEVRQAIDRIQFAAAGVPRILRYLDDIEAERDRLEEVSPGTQQNAAMPHTSEGYSVTDLLSTLDRMLTDMKPLVTEAGWLTLQSYVREVRTIADELYLVDQ